MRDIKEIEEEIEREWFFADCQQQIIESGYTRLELWDMVKATITSHEEVRLGRLPPKQD